MRGERRIIVAVAQLLEVDGAWIDQQIQQVGRVFEVEGGALAPEGDEGARRREMVDLLNKSIDMLELSVRAKNCLDSENVATMRDLVQLSEPELLKVRNFGKTSLKEVKSKLAALGLSLGMNIEEYKQG